MTFESDALRGVKSHYGVRVTDEKFGAGQGKQGVLREVSWTFDYNDLPVADVSALVASLPAGATPVEAYFQVVTAFAGGTSFDIDLVENDDSAIGTGKDKLWDALVLAEIDASEVATAVMSSTHTGTNSGNAVGAKLAVAGQLRVAATGTFTAGKARVTVTYLQSPAS